MEAPGQLPIQDLPARPWAEPRSRFTLLFERLAIDVLQEATVRGATRILRYSWDEAWHLIERAVKRGLQAKAKPVPARLGVDEKAISKGARYITPVCDLDASTIEYVPRRFAFSTALADSLCTSRPMQTRTPYPRSHPRSSLGWCRTRLDV